MELAQRKRHFLQISWGEHFIGGKNLRLNELFKSDMLIIVINLRSESNISHMHVHKDFRLSLEERIYIGHTLLSEDSPNLRKMMEG